MVVDSRQPKVGSTRLSLAQDGSKIAVVCDGCVVCAGCLIRNTGCRKGLGLASMSLHGRGVVASNHLAADNLIVM